MGGGAVKTIVMLMVLVVVSVIVGAQASEGVMGGASALASVGAFIAFAAMLFLGEKSWWVVFIAPLSYYVFPEKILNGLAFGEVFTPVFLAAWVFMRFMGTARFTWRSMPVMDLVVLLNFLWYVISYIRFPVAMEIMELDYDYVGGKEYVGCILATLFYIFYSSIDFPTEKLSVLVKWMFRVVLLCGVIVVLLSALGISGQSLSNVVSTMSHAQVRMCSLLVLGTATYAYVYTAYPLQTIFSSVWRLGALLFAAASILVSGGREYLVRAAFCLTFFALLKRELTVFILTGLCIYAGIFMMSEEHLIERLPTGTQRTLMILPGIHGKRSMEIGTEGSTDWRVTIWKWALDPRTGYIKDYWFGDGFQTSRRSVVRSKTAVMRGTMSHVDQADYAARAIWHNGFLACLNRTGIVGVGIALAFFLSGLITVVHVARAYGGPGGLWPYMAVLLLPFLEQVFVYFYMGDILDIFFSYQGFTLAKVFYCVARERGLLRPLFFKKQYIPMTIRELGNAA